MKRITPYFLFIITITIATFFWEKINLPFSLEEAHVGDSYLKNQHHSQNDTVRFVLFLSLPFLVLILYYQSFEKTFINNVKKIIYANY